MTRIGVITAWRASVLDLLGAGSPGTVPWGR